MDYVAELLTRWYALEGRVEPLEGDVDRNLKLVRPDGSRFLVKISGRDSWHVLEETTAVLRYLDGGLPRLPVETVLPAIDGRLTVPAPGEYRSHARVTGFLDGDPLSQVKRPSETLMEDLGMLLAKLGQGLVGYKPTAALASHDWDLRSLSHVRARMELVADREIHAQLERYLTTEWPQLLEQIDALPQQPIHNDLDGDNLLVAGDTVVGILDFGDMVVGPRVLDLAVTFTYVQSKWGKQELCRALLTGYGRQADLSTAELALLRPLVRARNALRTLNAYAGAASSPENAEYRLRNARDASTQFMETHAEFWKGILQ